MSSNLIILQRFLHCDFSTDVLKYFQLFLDFADFAAFIKLNHYAFRHLNLKHIYYKFSVQNAELVSRYSKLTRWCDLASQIYFHQMNQYYEDEFKLIQEKSLLLRTILQPKCCLSLKFKCCLSRAESNYTHIKRVQDIDTELHQMLLKFNARKNKYFTTKLNTHTTIKSLTRDKKEFLNLHYSISLLEQYLGVKYSEIPRGKLPAFPKPQVKEIMKYFAENIDLNYFIWDNGFEVSIMFRATSVFNFYNLLTSDDNIDSFESTPINSFKSTPINSFINFNLVDLIIATENLSPNQATFTHLTKWEDTFELEKFKLFKLLPDPPPSPSENKKRIELFKGEYFIIPDCESVKLTKLHKHKKILTLFKYKSCKLSNSNNLPVVYTKLNI